MTVRIARLSAIGLVAVATVSCSGSGGEGAQSTDAVVGTTTTPPVTSPLTTVPASTTTEPPVVKVPAGVNWASSSITPPAPDGTAPPSFEQVTATAGVPAAPAGYPFRASDYISQVFDVGGVQLATGSCGCWEGGNSTGVFGSLRTPVYLFRSVDAGVTWAQVDLSAALGDVNGRIEKIVEHDGALVLIATVGDASRTSPTMIQVLHSTDGAAWERVGSILSDAAPAVSVHGFNLFSLGSSLVVYGGDLACGFDGSSAVQNIGPAYQSRLWTSTDGGVTWVAQVPADTGLDSGRVPLPDAAACAGLGIQDMLDKFGSLPRLFTFTGDRLVVWSKDGQRIVTSDDGSTWATSTLDGVLAKPSDLVATPEVRSLASTVMLVEGQFTAMSLEPYRNFDDSATGSTVGLSIITWTSADGTSWQRQPLGRPIVSKDYSAVYRFFKSDRGFGLRAFNPSDSSLLGVYESVAGEAEDWSTCAAVAGGNCAFSTEVKEFDPGTDLSGIDLSYTSLEGRDLTDVSFKGARLHGINTADVTIDHTNFDGADIDSTQLPGDLSTSTFVGATLHNVTFDASFLVAPPAGATITSPRIKIADSGLPAGVTVAGRDLTDYSFAGGSLAGVDFSGANLTSASFASTDLTGANFTAANLTSVFFYEVTCPDGQPLTDGVYGAPACRL